MRELCLKCLRPQKVCFCKSITAFDTYFEFIILMHPMEAKKQRLGTGRLTHQALKNSRIIIDINFDENKEVQNLLQDKSYSPFILYPSDDSLNLSHHQLNKSLIQNKKPLIFIIDGTWPCAKKMMKLSTSLHTIPRLSFDSSYESQFRIKHQPAKYCLSTIESVYVVIQELERQRLEDTKNKKEVLLTSLKKLVNFQIECARDPNKKGYRRNHKAYKEPSEREQSKKWERRSIVWS